jgi:hypothetical protein
MTVTLKIPRLPRPKRLRLPKLSRLHGQMAAQCAGVLSVLVGVSAWSVPCAFILGGLVVITVIERQEVAT